MRTERRFVWGLPSLGVIGLLATATASSQAGRAEILVLSTRADLVTAGDALIEVRLPPGAPPEATRVAIDGRN